MGSSKALQAKRYRAFLKRLKQARLDAGLTQAEVTAKVGRKQTWVSKCELGERRIDFVELEDFATACGKPLTYFRTRPGVRRQGAENGRGRPDRGECYSHG